MNIQYLKHKEIDYSAWDKTISDSANCIIYAYTWYLDIVSPNWEALILGDYEYVMPLPVKVKYGFRFLVQPPITQQLGVFSKNEISGVVVKEFIRRIPYFSYHIQLNDHNRLSEATELPNYIIDLDASYEDIFAKYSKNHLKNLRLAKRDNVLVKNNLSNDVFFNFFLHPQETRNYAFPEKKLIDLLNKAEAKDCILNYGAFTPEGELIGVLNLLKTEKRLIVFMSYLSSLGKKHSALYLIMDEVIRHHSGKNMILDFEGSRIESIAYFFRGFGSVCRPYYLIKKHSVISLLEKLKK